MKTIIKIGLIASFLSIGNMLFAGGHILLERSVRQHMPEGSVRQHMPTRSVRQHMPERSVRQYMPTRSVRQHMPEGSVRQYMPTRSIRQHMPEGSVAHVSKVTTSSAKSSSAKPKRQMRGNMTLKYNILPGSVDTVGDMFLKGIVYKRLRSNTFLWDWTNENEAKKRKTNKAWGLGGSLVYKTAVFNGWSTTFAYYGSLNPDFFRMDSADVGFTKAGKDTFSRYKVKMGNGFGIQAIAQGFLEYNNGTIDIRAGRQLFESVFTKSNDTKMIPNSFDGITMSIKMSPKVKTRLAYFVKQKLRDHQNAHDLVTFKDEKGESWANNDDSAIHKGLNYDAFFMAGENLNHKMYLIDFNTKDIKNLNLTLSALSVPGIVQDFTIEAHYKIPLEKSGWIARPGIRYFVQQDDGGGAIAGDKNLKGKPLTGYAPGVIGSLDSSLINARIDLKMPDKKGFFRVGYSFVDDKADIFAPWRGFPTGGFTRAMAQYNWYANTKTYMFRAVYKFTPKLKASVRYAIQDFDDNKPGVQADSDVIHLDIWYNFNKNLQMKTRVGIAKANIDNVSKQDVSYNEYRLEFNYLF
ncbi:MAG: hypothetical protein LGB67_04355 [Sulfurovum sp.]|nr:hypothetical protein [Sulfurovum sp.]MCB4751999.1 hypothetical protein [Sulfurovum sp.]MCB4753583.1 hypothetical protein [Sulfurovum sp.]MCB4758370.1 hypothetical protein [Sulfurovum sp.]MCB4764479.1 hypothetical protein [Sulfurovum sp.]